MNKTAKKELFEVQFSDEEILSAVYKPEDDCTEKDLRIRALERQKIKASFVYFLRYVKILRPPTQADPGGAIPFSLWPHLKKAIKIILKDLLFLWGKSRQVGASWLVATFILWNIMTRIGCSVIIMSKGEGEGMEFLAKSKFIYKNLPDCFKLKLWPDSFTEMGFPTMDSKIRVLAATKTAGASYTCSILVFDEWQDHPYAEMNFIAAKPTRDDGGQMIGIYTQSADTLETLPNTLFTAALNDENNWTIMFTGWQEVPGRDQEWYQRTERDIPRENLLNLTPELYMRRNYPATIEEFLMPIQTTAAFNLGVVTQMMRDVRPSLYDVSDGFVKVIHDGLDVNIVKIYKEFYLGDYCICATDTSHGLGLDYSVSLIMNVKTGEIVADIMDRAISPEELGLQTVRMNAIFKNPLWIIEANDYGGVTISAAKRLNYPNLGTQDKREELAGFVTNESNRPLLWGDIIPAINNRQIIIHNADGLRQFLYVIRSAKSGGRIEAMSGHNDDYPLATAIAWYKRNEVEISVPDYKPIHSLTFGRNEDKLSWIKR